jgi:ABC-type dipeptide/oligopeptide/nickel transport system permease component
MEKRYGLDQPIIVQYGIWLGNALRGDLGESLRMQTSVSAEIVRRSGITIELTLLATLMSLVFGIPAGAVAALRRNSRADIGTRVVSLIGLSIQTLSWARSSSTSSLPGISVFLSPATSRRARTSPVTSVRWSYQR